MLHRALQQVSDTVAKGGRILFVGTKRQASEAVAEAARRSAQYYVNARWLGGTLTNWKTISNSIERLRNLDQMLEEGAQGLTKKERLSLTREREKLERSLGGIKDMGGVPDLLFVIDTNKEAIAIAEAPPAEHPGRGHRRHQLRSGRHHLPDPRQRRRRARRRALLRSRRACGDRRHLARPGRRRASTSAPPRRCPLEPALAGAGIAGETAASEAASDARRGCLAAGTKAIGRRQSSDGAREFQDIERTA